jgi:proline iminopeptidase
MERNALQVPVDGATIFCSVRGAGPVVLFPSLVGTAPQEHITEALCRTFTVVVIDVRGSGRSPGVAADLTFDVLAADIAAVQTAVGAPRAIVLGYSIGGVLAIEYARRRPAGVSFAVAVGTPPRGDMAAMAAAGTAFFEADASDERKAILRTNLAALPPDTPPTRAVLAQAPMRFYDARTDMAPLFVGAEVKAELLAHVLGPLTAAWDVIEDAASLRVPLLVAHGRHDYVVPHTVWSEVLPSLPTARFRLFERSGHQPFYEEPDAFIAVLSANLRSAP